MKHIKLPRCKHLSIYFSLIISALLAQSCGSGGGPGEASVPALEQETVQATAISVGAEVDAYKNSSQLQKSRPLINDDTVDQCTASKSGQSMDKFSDQISHHVSSMLEPSPVMVGTIGVLYGAPANDDGYKPSSLMSHPLCTVSTESLKKTLKKVPSKATVEKLNRFTTEMNLLRAQALAGNSVAKAELQKKWTRVFSCLSYSESLKTSDSSISRSVASRFAPDNYEKPPGVEFYEDLLQPLVSRLNIGMYQFTPNSAGNIKSCLKAWNEINSGSASCQVPTNGGRAEMIKILGSSQQSFNAFCGIHKVVETFAIQAYTQKASATHPSNQTASGLKSPGERCVTPYFYAGWAYNHFGPLQNSTGSNMDELHSCIENS